MTVTLMPDVDYVLWTFLAAQSEVSALVPGGIWRAAFPSDVTTPAVKLNRVSGDTLVGHPLALDQARIQVDVYGGTQRQANRIAETIRAVATTRLVNYSHADGYLQTCYASPPFYLPDENWPTSQGGPRPRYIVDLVITTRPPRPAA